MLARFAIVMEHGLLREDYNIYCSASRLSYNLNPTTTNPHSLITEVLPHFLASYLKELYLLLNWELDNYLWRLYHSQLKN